MADQHVGVTMDGTAGNPTGRATGGLHPGRSSTGPTNRLMPACLPVALSGVGVG
jgi:hypothetical protein